MPQILVVDDELEVRNLCGAVLRRHGFEAILAEDGAEGLRIYRERCGDIVLIISDVVMPRMNGLEMIQAIRGENSGASVLLMSGHSIKEILGQDLNIQAFVAKPFVPATLMKEVNRCLGPLSSRTPQ